MSNGANVRRGHGYEREVKRHFTDAGWGCMRGAGSKSGVRGKNHADLIGFMRSPDDGLIPAWRLFMVHGYKLMDNTSQRPFSNLASKITACNIRHVYYNVMHSDTWLEPGWTVVLMQCKISKRH